MDNKNIIIIRHFETKKDNHGNEKILYDKSLKKSIKFVNYIEKYLANNPNINKIKFYVSEQERTIITALILSNQIKSNIIQNKFVKIEIDEPIITNFINRDPKAKKQKIICDKIKNDFNSKIKNDILYIFVSHSSVIFNLFECFCKSYYYKYNEKYSKKIHSYSLSFISKKNNMLEYDFNLNLK